MPRCSGVTCRSSALFLGLRRFCAAFEASAPSSRRRPSTVTVVTMRLGARRTASRAIPKNFLATCTSSVPPLSCSKLIMLVAYAVTVAQPSFDACNYFSPLAAFPDAPPAISLISSACGLFFSLGSLFRTPILCFQSFANSFAKHRGCGYLRSCCSRATGHE